MNQGELLTGGILKINVLNVPSAADFVANGTSDKYNIGIAVDTETTGIDSETSDMYQFGMVVFAYEPDTGDIAYIIDVLSDTWEPESTFSPRATEITGMTLDKLEGKKPIYRAQMRQWIKDADLIIAHRAVFDRPFIEKEFKCARKAIFACTMDDVDWNRNVTNSLALPFLCFMAGFSYVGHHAALADAYALFALLNSNIPGGEGTVMQSVMRNAAHDYFMVEATGAPFSTKDKLREIGMHWNAQRKVWCMLSKECEVSDIVDRLVGLYNKEPDVICVEPEDRFTQRA